MRPNGILMKERYYGLIFYRIILRIAAKNSTFGIRANGDKKNR